MSWNKVLDDARKEFPNPFDDPRRIKKGRGWKKETPVRVPPSLEQVMGSIYTSHKLNRKLSAPDRVMDKAMQYHTVESNMRRAKHVMKLKDPNRFDLLIFIFGISFCCFGVWIASQLAMR